jgi:2',3'-cyclic-nucleotide 2'-phosphodiesterase (5'-nucleotidase family)
MLPSANVHYQLTTTGGPDVVDGSVSFDGGTTPIDKTASYRIAVNNFMADGGDNYTVFRSCTPARRRDRPRRIRTLRGRH